MKYFVFYCPENYCIFCAFKAFKSKAAAEKYVLRQLKRARNIMVISGKKEKLSSVVKEMLNGNHF